MSAHWAAVGPLPLASAIVGLSPLQRAPEHCWVTRDFPLDYQMRPLLRLLPISHPTQAFSANPVTEPGLSWVW